MSLIELNIFEIKIHLDTNIKESRNVIFEREMLYDPKKRASKKTESKQIDVPVAETPATPSNGTQIGGDENTFQRQNSFLTNSNDTNSMTTIHTLNKYPFLHTILNILNKF